MNKENKLSRALTYFLMVAFFIFMTSPIIWIFITSVKSVKEIVTIPITYFPKHFTLKNYESILKTTNFPVYFKNSVIVGTTASIGTLIISLFAGYSLARFKFAGKKLTLFLFLATQMVPVAAIIVPIFMLFSKLGLINNLLGLIIIYIVLNIPFCTMMIRGFFEKIPYTLEEAAMIDGCSRIQALIKIILPVMKPGIIATFVFAFMGAWNELFFNTLFISREGLKTLPTGINAFIGKYDIDWGMMTAGSVIALIPIFIMFGVIQKYLVGGLTDGAVKG
ncbi:carbohydrate ABC transporter permease [Clostridium sp. CM028]|uniref:carbohydrate ABC transporter permease n=1 Tax=unclassified Clostridium TaxID=2614128 RepID=UPI001C0D8DBB|nr:MULTISPECIES: carbohydrate ABC transporter permease [unclassified Clostridium]MBU3092897.1 carbohydrate ABC transporter permease [Clostridium sp. CF011]MBW9149932.1 carbohydrate ABC transporter permease [Clostridium sp. CM028]WAG70829.1 carbohydrate ABC transporter permease [Clostridium sp. CF011]WLC62455.1 carbohydrate ABC transporter permease [Clostridium sp. CM028]